MARNTTTRRARPAPSNRAKRYQGLGRLPFEPSIGTYEELRAYHRFDESMMALYDVAVSNLLGHDPHTASWLWMDAQHVTHGFIGQITLDIMLRLGIAEARTRGIPQERIDETIANVQRGVEWRRKEAGPQIANWAY